LRAPHTSLVATRHRNLVFHILLGRNAATTLTIGTGLMWGQRVNKDNAKGDVFRLNFVMQYELAALRQDLKMVLPF
jgi:hypothetical protein